MQQEVECTGKEALGRSHQIKHNIQKKEQWPFFPSTYTGQQMKTAVINLIKGNTMFLTNIEFTTARCFR